MARIAVEESLTNVKQALENQGHEVVNMQADNLKSCECCVISGQDNNVMGVSNAATKAVVINAEGLSAEDVIQQVNQRIER